jgi:hypothetical protein
MLHAEAGIAEARSRMQAGRDPDARDDGDAPCPPSVKDGARDAPASAVTQLNEVTAPVVGALGKRVTEGAAHVPGETV